MIKLKYVKGEVFMYDIDDWKALRLNHRIIGQIIGSTSFIPSLPVKLLPEEALLLLDNDLAEVYGSYNGLEGKMESTSYCEETLLRVQQQEYKEFRKLQLQSLIDKIVEKRRKSGDNRSKEDIFNEELDKSSTITKGNMLWPILLQDNKSDLVPISREIIFSLTTPLKSIVFKDLWNMGYYITNGEKFGGDFLVYFGDPIVHHAIFIVKCIGEEQTITPTDLIAFGRLGVAVKKRAILGSVKDGKVSYVTINWIDA